MRNLHFVLFLLTLFTTNAYAWGLKDFGEEAATPVTTSAKYVLIAGSLITYGLAVSSDQVGDPFDAKQRRNNTLGDASRWGDWMGQLIPNALYVGGMAIASRYQDPKAHYRAIGMFKATAYSVGVTTVLKYSIREPRIGDHSTRNSFPSGHSTSAFAFSGYVAGEHGWGWGSAALLLSTFTAYSRINDGAHRLHDVAAGATIGWVYGWGIARQKKQEMNEAFIVPILDSRTAGVSVFKEF
jgi:membrane-associated phospholipid phosphatase